MRYLFGDHSLDTQRCELGRAGKPIPLRPKAFQLLVYLLTYRDRVVPKRELLDHLWPDQFIGDATLNSCLMAVRKAIGDSGQSQHIIQTLRGLGYRFIAEVEVDQAGATTSGGTPAATVQRCMTCQHPHHPQAIFCEACGARLAQACPRCMCVVTLTAAFCPWCGQPLGQASQLTPATIAAPTRTSADAGEPELVTVLCCTVAETTCLATQLGAETMDYLMQGFFVLADRVIRQYEGTIIWVDDNGFTAFFGTPVGQEDHARRAVLAALELRQRLTWPPEFSTQTQGTILALCMGLHTGPVVAGYVDDDPQCLDTTDLAACLQHLAASDTVLVSDTTYRLVQQEVRADPWGACEHHEPSLPIPVYMVRSAAKRVAGVPGHGTPPLSRFVGRDRTLTLRRSAWLPRRPPR